MTHTKYHDPWLNSYAISAEAMNHLESQWTAIYSQIVIHQHDGRYYTKTESDSKFFSTTFFTGFDADMLDSKHFDDILSSVLPTGAIMIWSGSDANIPEGWFVCDGIAHYGKTTPNLKDRFIIAAGGNYSPGATGGPDTWNGTITPSGSVTVGRHALTTEEIPSHTHAYTETGAGSAMYKGGTVSVGGGPRQTRSTNVLEQTTGGGAHDHTTGSYVSFNSIDPRPKYFALYYIMKCL